MDNKDSSNTEISSEKFDINTKLSKDLSPEKYIENRSHMKIIQTIVRTSLSFIGTSIIKCAQKLDTMGQLISEPDFQKKATEKISTTFENSANIYNKIKDNEDVDYIKAKAHLLLIKSLLYISDEDGLESDYLNFTNKLRDLYYSKAVELKDDKHFDNEPETQKKNKN